MYYMYKIKYFYPELSASRYYSECTILTVGNIPTRIRHLVHTYVCAENGIFRIGCWGKKLLYTIPNLKDANEDCHASRVRLVGTNFN